MQVSMNQEFELYTLDNGLRLLHLNSPSQPVEYCGVVIKAGARDDGDYPGLAHFVEHTIFKGTTRRSAKSIINYMEAVGGELNAYTTKEETFIYSAFPAGNLRRAVNLIADLVNNSCFPDRELDRERLVIAEEIDSYLDNPSESVIDDFEDLMFAGSPLGHNILGSSDTITEIVSSTCRTFIDRLYHPDNMLFFYSGPSKRGIVEKIVKHYFCSDNQDSFMPKTALHELGMRNRADYGQQFSIRRKDADTHQAHTVIGVPAFSLYSDRRFALALLNNILGGPGMNSLLNVALREKRGLVYSVDSASTLYSDCGTWTVYFGCSPEKVDFCKRIIARQIESLASSALSPRRLEAAKKQFIGQMIVGTASPEQLILSAARSALYRNSVSSTSELAEKIKELSSTDILEIAQMIASAPHSMLTIG